ncbi:hypothetical protein DAPPUDRAFT_254267 [Daphnia pulex]|uniref:Uncharacterized protein n=1 Tax=Daphnia pulex TaxID=6669 RepID=E9H6P5_DAPPU|nr:hypothetical protein DAPPUDRAFT_254267 [Daphnia pulex]|eukprot:EFX72545.1 hypothetical protein DAPPUDRAFT_254267 [Daphnia pulex]
MNEFRSVKSFLGNHVAGHPAEQTRLVVFKQTNLHKHVNAIRDESHCGVLLLTEETISPPRTTWSLVEYNFTCHKTLVAESIVKASSFVKEPTKVFVPLPNQRCPASKPIKDQLCCQLSLGICRVEEEEEEEEEADALQRLDSVWKEFQLWTLHLTYKSCGGKMFDIYKQEQADAAVPAAIPPVILLYCYILLTVLAGGVVPIRDDPSAFCVWRVTGLNYLFDTLDDISCLVEHERIERKLKERIRMLCVEYAQLKKKVFVGKVPVMAYQTSSVAAATDGHLFVDSGGWSRGLDEVQIGLKGGMRMALEGVDVLNVFLLNIKSIKMSVE